jgi:hypothetical protein
LISSLHINPSEYAFKKKREAGQKREKKERRKGEASDR